MKKLFLTFTFAMAIANYSYPQATLEWVQRYRGYEASSISANGNIYVTGTSSDSLITIKYNSSGAIQWVQKYSPVFTGFDSPVLKIDGSENVYVFGNHTSGSVIIKYNSSGVQQWNNALRWMTLRAVEIDKSNNVYFTGSASDSLIEQKFVTIKYNPSGSKEWERYYSSDTTNYDGAIGIAVDDPGNVYVTGYSFVNSVTSYITTVKYNSSGNEQWVKRYGTFNIESAPKAIAVDNSQNVYVTGYSSDSGAFIKYNSNGVEQWVVKDGSGLSISVDKSQNIYIAGLNIDVTIDSAVTLKKYNPSGIRQWAALFQGYASGDDSRIPMTIDSLQNVYLSYMGIDTNLTSTNIVTSKCNPSGVKQWLQTFNGAGNSDDYTNGIAVDNSGNVYVAGSSIDTITNNRFVTIKYSQIISNVSSVNALSAGDFRLEQNFPNPFNPVTIIRYSSIETGHISLKVYDMLGKEVVTLVNETQNAGSHEIKFNASGIASGIYFYQIVMHAEKLTADRFTDTKRMILLK